MLVSILGIWNASANRTDKIHVFKELTALWEKDDRQNKYINDIECETVINAVEKLE